MCFKGVCFKKGRDPEGSLVLRLYGEELLLLGVELGAKVEDCIFGFEFSFEE